ncbi:LOW QUALITY PROTEIN: hypothetical protein V1477_006452, partial [Vespula maculifrons]
IFLSETIASRRTGPGSFERARRALYAHIFFDQIGPNVAEKKKFFFNNLFLRNNSTYENRTRVSGKGSSRPLRPYFPRPDRTNRSRDLGEPYGGSKGKKNFSFTIFFSETIAPRRTGPGSFERARRVLYAHIFCVQIGPIGAEVQRKKNFSLTIFFFGTIAPRRTRLGSSERARRALYAHIFFDQIGPIFKDNKGKKHFSLTIFFSETIAPRRTGPRSFERGRRALYAHIFRVQENQAGVIGKGSSRPLCPYFLRPDRSKSSRVITHLGEPDRGRLKELVAPSTPIFSSTRSVQNTYENRTRVSGKGSSRPLRPYFSPTDRTNRSGFKGNKGKKHCSLRIFLSETIAPRRTERGSLERARRALYAYIVFVQIGPIGAEWNKGKKNFSFAIFFSETVAPRRTGPGSFERARRALYAHIFFVQIGPIGAELLQFKDNKGKKHFYLRIFLSETIAPRRTGPRSFERKKHFSLTIFFSETVSPRRTGPGSFERARRALYAHIFCVQENQSGVIGKGSSRPLRPYFPRPDRTNRSRVITVFREQRKKNFSLTIFFSETIAPRRTGPGSFVRARRALYAHIFCVQIGPIGAERTLRRSLERARQALYAHIFFVQIGTIGAEGSKGKKNFSFTIFFSETIAPRRTGPGSFERARRVLYAHIFCVQIGPIGAEVQRKKNFSLTIFFFGTIAPRRTRLGSSERARRALYAHIFFDQIGPIFKDNKGKKHFSLTIFFSETIAPRRTGPRSFERGRRALYAHIFRVQENQAGVIGKGSSRPLCPYFLRPDRSKSSRVITHLGEPDRGRLKELVAPSTPIFSSTRSHLREPDSGLWKGLVALSTLIFFAYRSVQNTYENRTRVSGKGSSRPLRPYFSPTDRTNRSGFKGNKGKKHCSLRIFLSETIAPRRTERGSLERARRALYAYIVFVQIGPIGAEWNKGKKNFSFAIFFSETVAPRRTGPGSFERARRALYAHIFFVQIGPIGAELLQFKDNKGKKHFYLRIFLSETIAPRRTGPRSFERKKHFSLTIFFSETVSPRRTGPGSFERARRALYAHIFCVQENQSGVIGKGSSRPLRPYFPRPDRTNRSRVITVFREQRKKNFSLTIFFSETIAPRRTGPGSFVRARRALYAHIFCVQIGPIGAEGSKGKKNFSFTIFFSETIAPRRTGPGSFERARRVLYAHIFCVQIGPIGAEVQRKKNFSLTIFFFGTIAPRRTRLGSSERARRALYAHIFFDQIGPIFKDNKGKKHFSLTIFFSETIAPRRTGPRSFERGRRALYAHIFRVQHLGEPDRGRLKELVAPSTPIFSSTRSHLREPDSGLWKGLVALSTLIFFAYRSVQNTYENRTRVSGKGSSRPLRPYFSPTDRTNRSGFKGNKGKKHCSLRIFLSETIAPRRTERGSLERARRALYAYIVFVQIGPIGAEWNKGKKNFSFAIFFSETVAPRRTGPGSFERARRALYAHIFFVQIGPIGAELLQFKDNKGKKHFYLRIFLSETIAPRRTGPRSFENNKGKKHFSLTIFFSETVSPRRTGPGSFERARRALYAHIFCVQENQSGVIGKGSSRPLRPYFPRPDRTNRSRVITVFREQRKKNFSLTIFFSETIAPRRTGPGSFVRARRALYAHIFCVQIGPIGAEGSKGKKNFSFTIFFSETIAPRRTGPGSFKRARRVLYAHIFCHLGEPDWGHRKGLVAPSTHIFSSTRSHLGEPDRGRLKELVASSTHIFFAYRSDQKEPIYNGNKGKKNFSLTIFFSGTKAPRRTRLVSLESAHRALYAHIFVIFLSETVAPRRTGPGSFVRARRALYAHIFCVQIGPIGAEWNKGEKNFSLTIFFSGTKAPRRTRLGSLESARRALYAHIFFDQIGPKVAEEQRKKIFFFTIFFSETIAPRRTGPGSFVRALRALYAHIFCVQIGPIGAERTGPGSLESARRALYAHIFFDQIRPKVAELKRFKESKGKKHFSLTIFFSETVARTSTGAGIFLSETIASRRTGPGSFERARRALYAHIFCVQIGPIGADTYENRSRVSVKGSSRPLRPYFLRTDRTNRSRFKGNKGKKHCSLRISLSETIAPRRTEPGSLGSARHALYAHIFFVQIGPIEADTYENRSRVSGKGSSRPLRPYFLRTDRTYRSRFKDNKGKKHFSLTIFFSETIAPRRTRTRSFERGRRALYAHIFRVKFKDNKGKKHFSLTIFFSETIAPRRTGPRSFERGRRALYAHIFRVQHLGEPDRGRLKELVAPSTPIFSSTRSHLREPDSGLWKGLVALSTLIFFAYRSVQNTYENRTRVSGKGSSRPLRPYFSPTDRTNRSGFKGNKGKKHCSLRIFLSETIAPRRTERGSLERARRALYAYIVFVQIGPIGAEWNKGKKNFSFAIFFSETVAPRRTGPGSFERARRALYAHIFFVQIGPIGAELLQFKDNKGKKHFYLRIFLSETIAPRRTGPRSFENNKGKKHFSLTIFFSETVSPRRTGPGSFERARRALYAHIFCVQENQSGVIGKGSSRPLRPYFPRPDRTNRSRVITVFREQRKKNFSLTIFFSETIAPRRTGPGSFVRARRALYAHIFCVQIGPIGAEGSKGKKNFSFTIFFSETIAPRRTGPGSFERARRVLYAHIFCVQIGPIGAEVQRKKNFSLTIFFFGTIAPRRTRLGSSERARRALYAHIFFDQIGPIFKDNKGKKHFSLTIFFSETIAPRRTGPRSFERGRRALYAHIFRVQHLGEPDRGRLKELVAPSTPIFSSTRSHLREPDSGLWKGLVALSTLIFFAYRSVQNTYENRTRVSGKGSSRPLRPYFSPTDRTNRSGFKGNKGKKHCSLRIFLSETIAPRRTERGSLERARRALYAYIVFVQIGPIGAEWNKGKKNFSFAIFFSETVAPRRTGPGSFERARRALYAHIFFVQIGPIGAELLQFKDNKGKKHFYLRIFLSETIAPRRTGPRSFENNKGKKHFSLTIFFSETVSPRRTGPGSFERARRALYAHIFCVQENQSGVIGKGSSRPLRPYFPRPDRTNRSRVITVFREQRKKNFSLTIFFSETIAPRRTGPGSFVRARRALYAHIFCVQIGPIGAEGSKGKKNFSFTIFFSETIAPRRTGPGSFKRARRVLYAHIFCHLGEPDWGHRKGLVAPSTHIFSSTRSHLGEPDRGRLKELVASSTHIFFAYRSDQKEPIYNGNKGKKNFSLTIFFSGTKAPRRTRLVSLESAHRALYAHIFVIFLSETVAPRRTGPGSFVRARRALYAHIFCVQIGPIGAEWNKGEKNFSLTIFFSGTKAPRRTRLGSLESARRALYAHIFFDQIGPKVAEEQRKKIFFFTIFFSETIAPRRTGPGSFVRALRALYAHIFCVQIGPIGAERTGPGSLESARRALYAHIFFDQIRPKVAELKRFKESKGKKHFSLTIFFSETVARTSTGAGIFLSETIASRRTGPGSFERARRALYAHIFCVQIGPIGADTYENRSRVSVKGSSRPLRPYFLRTDRTNRSRFKGNKGKKHCSLRISLSETIAPRRTEPGSLGSARHALYAHIFFVQIGPIEADTYENRSRVSGKGSSRPLRPYFLRTDRTYRSRFKDNKGKKHFSLTIFFSETIAPRRTRTRSFERGRRALYAHIFRVKEPSYNGLQGKKEKKIFFLHLFSPELYDLGEPGCGHWKGLVAPSMPIFSSTRSHLGEPDRGRLKELVAPSTPIFSSTRSVQNTYENQTRVSGKGSSRPLRPYFSRTDRTNRSRENGTLIIGKDSSRPLRPYFLPPDRTNRSRVITHLGEPYRGHWKGLVKPSTHIFFCPDRTKSSRVITNKGKKYFSLTISFSETVARTRTGAGYLERARRALYAHIFCVQIGPIGAEIFLSETIAPRRTGPGSFERARRALYAHIFFDQIGPKVADTYENRTRVTGKGSSRPLRPYFFRTGWTNRSRHLGEPYGGHWKGLVKPSTHIFFCPDRNNRSRVITHLGEPDRGRLKELVASSTHIFFAYRSDQEEPIYNGNKGKKNFSLTIFFSGTKAPRRTRLVSVERGHRALYAHIFCVQIGPIGAEIFFSETIAPTRTRPGSFKGLVAPSTPIFFAYRTYENRARVIGKGPSRPLRPYFLRTDRTNRSRHQREPDYGQWKGSVAPSTTIFFAYTPRRTGPGSFERARGALYAHIFCVHIGPIGAEEQKTIVPRRTGPGSFERARRFLYAHIFYEPSYNGLQGTKEKKLFFNNFFLRNYNTYENRTLIIGKDTSRPLLPHFFRPDRTNRSRAITENRTLIIGKDPSRPLRPYFLRTDRTNRSRVITHLAEPSGGHWKGLVASSTHIFFTTYENRTLIIGKGSSRPLRTYFLRTDRTNRSRVITHLGEPEQGQWKGAIAPSTPIFFAYRSDQWEPIPRRTGPGSFERARRFLYAHIFYVQIGPIGADTYENRTLIIGKDTSRPLRPHFFRPDRTNRSRAITENRTLIIGKGSSRPLRPYFLRTDRTNRSRVITHLREPDLDHWKGHVARSTPIFFSSRSFKENKGKKHFSLTIFFSETIAPRRTGPGSFERGRRVLYAHIFYENWNRVSGKGPSRPPRPYFLRTDRTNRSRVITHLGEPYRGRLKGSSLPLRPYFLRTDQTNRSRVITYVREPNQGKWKGPVAPSTPIFFATYENRTVIIGKGPSRPLRPYFLRTDRTNRSRVITHLGEPDRGHLKGSSRPLRPYFFRPDRTNRSRVITHLGELEQAPWRTGPGSFERARRVLYVQIFRVQIGPIGADTYENRSRVSGKGSSRPLRPHFLRTYRTNRSRVITYLREPDLDHWKGLVASSTHIFFTTYENRTLIIGEDSSRPLRQYFFRPDRTNRSRAITEKKFSLTIFFSENIAPSRAVRGSLERARGVLYAHIFYENRNRVSGKGPSRPLRPYFLRTDRTNRSRVITHLGEPDRGRLKGSSRPLRPYFLRTDRTNRSGVITGTKENKFFLTIFFSEAIARTRTEPGSVERGHSSLYAHIFCVQIGPIGAEIFFSGTIAHRRTRPGSLERARRALYDHIFCVQIGPIGAEL